MFESSTEEGKLVSIPEYCSRMRAGQRDIYYLAAPSRQLAESSPYYEAMKKKDVEILFCYESYDELVLMQLQQFDNKRLKSAEKEMREDPKDEFNKLRDAKNECLDKFKACKKAEDASVGLIHVCNGGTTPATTTAATTTTTTEVPVSTTTAE